VSRSETSSSSPLLSRSSGGAGGTASGSRWLLGGQCGESPAGVPAGGREIRRVRLGIGGRGASVVVHRSGGPLVEAPGIKEVPGASSFCPWGAGPRDCAGKSPAPSPRPTPASGFSSRATPLRSGGSSTSSPPPACFLWDRRQAERRAAWTPVGKDRRRGDRRQSPASTWATLGFVIVPSQEPEPVTREDRGAGVLRRRER
jgi:hypothetical protein